jgi:hypothetical protein
VKMWGGGRKLGLSLLVRYVLKRRGLAWESMYAIGFECAHHVQYDFVVQAKCEIWRVPGN